MRNTIILLVVALALGAYVYWGEIKGGEKRKEEKAKAEKLFPVKKDSIKHIWIHKPTTQFEFEKTADGWMILQPVKTDADESPINSLLYGITNTKKIRTFKASAKDLATYGLDDRAIKLEFSGKGIARQGVKIGDRTPVGGNIFVTKNDSDIIIVSSSFKNSVDKTLFNWRDKKVLHFKKDKIREFTLRNPHGKFHFVKEGSDWKITEPLQTKGENSTINAVLNKLEWGRINSVAAETPKNLSKYGLSHPAYRLELFSGKEKAKLGVSFSRVKNNKAYGKDDARPHIFVVDSFFVKPFNKTLFDYRDKKITTFDRSKVDRINLLYKSNLMIFEKDSLGNWHLSTGEKAKNWKITNLLSSLNSLKATSFVDDHPRFLNQYGLLNPEGHIEVYAGNDKLVELQIGKAKNDKLIYARNPLLKSVVTIKKSALKKLFPKKEDLLEPKPKKESENKASTDTTKKK